MPPYTMKQNHYRLLAALLFSVVFVNAQKKTPLILFKSGAVKTEYNISEANLARFNTNSARIKNKTVAVLQFQTLPTAQTKKYLATQGVEFLEYIPENAYTVSITGNIGAGVLQKASARALLELDPKQKMHPMLAKGQTPEWSKKEDGTIEAWVSFQKVYSAADMLQFLSEKGIEIISAEFQKNRVIIVRLLPNRIQELAAAPIVEYVEPSPPQDGAFNENSRNVSRANLLQAPIVTGGRALTGEGVVIGIGDEGDVQTHSDVTGPRLINRTYNAPSSHATHVHTTAAGAGIVNELYKGYAPKATILSQYFSNIIFNPGVYVNDHGMVLTNNSYGGGGFCGYYGFYTMSSRILDQQAFEFPNLQHVFAAGNDGYRNCAPYPASYHTVFGGYQSAKNVITVGATQYDASMMPNSSRGPVQDGRTKPEVSAMGSGVYSATLNNGYKYGYGTSFAAPAVSGGLALLYQRYRQLHEATNPKNGLMKALLCNGGTDKGNTGPDYNYGFGWMDLSRSLEMLEKNQYVNANIIHAGSNNHTITVPPNTAQLRVMLYWNDPAASLLSSRSLVNDLDLRLVDPSSSTHLPLILDTSATGILNVATTGADHLNNMEQVVVSNPAAGSYTINISAAIAENLSQEYFVVYDFIPVGTQLTFPSGGEALVPGETAVGSV